MSTATHACSRVGPVMVKPVRRKGRKDPAAKRDWNGVRVVCRQTLSSSIEM